MRAFSDLGRTTAKWLKRFIRAERGNTAMMFGMAAVALVTASGAAIDWSRALVAKERLGAALDAAGLAIGTTNGLSQNQLQSMAQQYFNANYPSNAIGTPSAVSVTVNGQTMSLSVTATVPTTLLNMAHIDHMDLSVSNQIVRAVTKLRVALVLDNTGSMDETDATGTTKISALRTASHQLLTQLQNAAINPGDVQVAVIPFSKDVNVGTGNVGANWIRWTEWDAANTTSNTTTICTGGGCSSGQTSCNGLNSGNSTCNCSGSGNNKRCRQTITTTADHNTWNGCVMDRDQSNDESNTTAVAGSTATLFPAEQYGYCTPASMTTLGYNWTALNSMIDTMVSNGSTNQTIGLALGWQTLTQGSPFNAPAADPTVRNIIILLSDGLNTQDRWYGNGSSQSTSVDNRMAAACTNAKNAGITIYTVMVMAGNSSILSNCATDSSKYFELTTAGQIVTAFNTIGTELANLHLAQ